MVFLLLSLSALAFRATAFVDVDCNAGQCADASPVKPRAGSAMMQKRSQAILTQKGHAQANTAKIVGAYSKVDDGFCSNDWLTQVEKDSTDLCAAECEATSGCISFSFYEGKSKCRLYKEECMETKGKKSGYVSYQLGDSPSPSSCDKTFLLLLCNDDACSDCHADPYYGSSCLQGPSGKFYKPSECEAGVSIGIYSDSTCSTSVGTTPTYTLGDCHDGGNGQFLRWIEKSMDILKYEDGKECPFQLDEDEENNECVPYISYDECSKCPLDVTESGEEYKYYKGECSWWESAKQGKEGLDCKDFKYVTSWKTDYEGCPAFQPVECDDESCSENCKAGSFHSKAFCDGCAVYGETYSHTHLCNSTHYHTVAYYDDSCSKMLKAGKTFKWGECKEKDGASTQWFPVNTEVQFDA